MKILNFELLAITDIQTQVFTKKFGVIDKMVAEKCWYYVAVAQRFNRLKTLKSLLKFLLNRDFYYDTKVTQARVS